MLAIGARFSKEGNEVKKDCGGEIPPPEQVRLKGWTLGSAPHQQMGTPRLRQERGMRKVGQGTGRGLES